MASDVREAEEDVRYRGFDCLSEESDDDSTENATKTTIERQNNTPNVIDNTILSMEQRIENQAKTISKLQENKHAEFRKEAAWTNEEEVEKLRQTITEQAEMIRKLQEELTHSNENLEDVGNDCKKRKRGDTSDEMNLAMVADSFNKDEKIRELNKEIEILKYELRQQKSPKAVADKSTESKPTRTLPSNPPLPNIATLLQDLQLGVEKKITDMKVSIEASLEEKIANAFESKKSFPTIQSTYASAVGDTSNSQATKQGNQFRTIIAETKNEELLTKNDRQRRETNIIVHGVKERSKCPESRMKEHDVTYINELLAVLGVNLDVKLITRLGNINSEGKCRPIKLVMNSVEDKELVMSRLSNLKSAEDQFKFISVKDDYTPSERELIKYKYNQAQEMNERDNTNEWKVRGSPKNGLRIAKIKKNASIQEPSSSNNGQILINATAVN